MGTKDRFEFEDDFNYGAGTFATSASAVTPWRVADTSSAGTPTYQAGIDQGTTGGTHVARLAFDSTAEIQNVCLYFGDVLQFDIDDDLIFECRLKMGQATADTATSFAFGMTGDRNDAIDSVAQAALFRVIGADSTTAVVCETDDGTNDNDDKSTGGVTLINAFKSFKIDFSDKTSVKFYITDANGVYARVAFATTFDMSNYAGALQPFFQLQKSADNNTDFVDIDWVKVSGQRNT